jgi:hypothetical protein
MAGPSARAHGRARFVGGLLLALIIASTTRAQGTNGRLTGTIRDSTAAAVADVRISAIEIETGREWTTATDPGGAYAFAGLPPGNYGITATRPGFKTFAARLISVNPGETVRIDATLELGSLDERVEVTGNSVNVQTDSTAVTFRLSAAENASLPTAARNFLALTLLAPGIVAPNPGLLTTGLRTTSGGRPYVNGNRKEGNNFRLDGIDNNQTTDNLVSYQPSPDAIEEVRLTTATASAESGNYQGAIIDVTLKSGTNRLQGSAFEYFRDETLNAANWRRKWMPADPLNPRKPPFSHNVFGGTIGGPIVPGRVFFFGDYEGTRRRNGLAAAVFSVVPTAMRRGDFSALLEGPNPQQLYDPTTARADPANPQRVLRDPFPNNQIPLNRIDPVAAALFASPLYPAPSREGLIANADNASRSTLDNDQFDVKVDARFGRRDDLSARYAEGLQRTATANTMRLLMGSATRSPFRALALAWRRQLGTQTVNEARAGFHHIVALTDSGIDAAGIGRLGEQIGIRGANTHAAGLPAIELGGSAFVGGATKVAQSFEDNTFQYQDDLTWHRGDHTAKAGALILHYRQDVYFSGNTGQLGIIEFNGQYTRDLNDPRSIGSPIADFLLGYPRRLARGDFAPPWGQRSTLWGGYVQDDWHVNATLTLNLGLRYEYRSPFVEAHDRQVNFDLRTGRAQYAGKDGNSRGLFRGYKYDWQPRTGLAWTPARGRLVVRGAYTVSSFLEGTGTNLRLTLNPPFFNEFETINADPAVLGTRTGDGFDALREKDPLSGTILRAWDPNLRPARSHQWNLTTEYQLAGDTALALAYVGEYGAHLVAPVNFDQRPAPGEPRPFDATYPQIGGVILTTSNAKQRYDGLQLSARKRGAGGTYLSAAYTWSLAMTNSRGFFSEGGQTAEQASFGPNPRDLDADWGPAPFDVRHSLAVAAVADLPFGRQRRFFANAPGWVNGVVGGWSVAGILKAHTGFAITVTAPDQSLTGARSGRPDRVASGVDPRQVGPGRFWFDTSTFVLPQTGTFGNAGVGILRGPGLRVLDLSVAKQVALASHRSLEFRAEAFNVFNTPVFEAPDRSLTSATFGQVLGSQLEREVQLAVRVHF